MTLPSKEAVDKFLKARKEKREKARGKKDGEAGAGGEGNKALMPPQGLAADAELADWRTTLLDLAECVAVDDEELADEELLTQPQVPHKACDCPTCPGGTIVMMDDVVAAAAESPGGAHDTEPEGRLRPVPSLHDGTALAACRP